MSIEWIKDGEEVIAVIVPSDYVPDSTEFITPNDYKQQLGFVVYGSGESIIPHVHKKLGRNLLGTSEVLLVKKGKAEVILYNNSKKEIARRILNEGDIILLVSGGHGFKMHKDTVLFEVKQGPYIGVHEKERF